MLRVHGPHSAGDVHRLSTLGLLGSGRRTTAASGSPARPTSRAARCPGRRNGDGKGKVESPGGPLPVAPLPRAGPAGPALGGLRSTEVRVPASSSAHPGGNGTAPGPSLLDARPSAAYREPGTG